MNSKAKRKAIVAAANRLARRQFPDFPAEGWDGACLLLAGAVVDVAAEHGIRLVLQAGSAYWPRVTSETDDGVEPNVFGYEWEPARARAAVEADMLPELHVWAGDPVTNHLVDLTTGAFPRQCRRLLGIGWKAPAPPAWFWGPFDRLPRGCVYKPTLEATLLAAVLLRRARGEWP